MGKAEGGVSDSAQEGVYWVSGAHGLDPCKKNRHLRKRHGIAESGPLARRAAAVLNLPEGYAETGREMRRRRLRANFSAGLETTEAGACVALLPAATGLAWPGRATRTKSENANWKPAIRPG